MEEKKKKSQTVAVIILVYGDDSQDVSLLSSTSTGEKTEQYRARGA